MTREAGQTCFQAVVLLQVHADPVHSSPGIKCFCFLSAHFPSVFSVQMKLQDDVTSQMTELQRLNGRTTPRVPARGRLLVICVLKVSLVKF